jgi:hypothetical protein
VPIAIGQSSSSAELGQGIMTDMRGLGVVVLCSVLLVAGCAHEDRLTVRNETGQVITVVAIKGTAAPQLLDTIQAGGESEVALGDNGCSTDSLEAINPGLRVVSRVSAPICATDTWTVSGG